MFSLLERLNPTSVFFIVILLPSIYYFVMPQSRISYFETVTSIQTSDNQKISFFALALIVSIFLALNFNLIFNTKFYSSIKIRHQIYILMFFLFGFSLIPLYLAVNNYPKTVELISSFFRVSYLSPPFADLRTIILGIGCNDVNAIGDLIVCDSRNSKFVTWNYPTILLKLRFLYLGLTNFLLLFIIIAVLITILLYKLSKNQNQTQNFLLTIFLISPPFLLCINRMNFDLLITINIWLGAYLLRNQTSRKVLISVILFLFSGIFKFYGFATLVFLILTQKAKLRIYSFFAFIVGFSLVLKDLPLLEGTVGKDIYGSIGLPVLNSLLNGKSSAKIQPLSGGFLIIFFVILVTCSYLVREFSILKMNFEIDFATLIPGFVLLFTWLSASNYYYRTILTFPILISLTKNRMHDFEKIIVGATVSSYFLSPKIFGPLQNLLLLPLICYLLSIFYIKFFKRFIHFHR